MEVEMKSILVLAAIAIVFVMSIQITNATPPDSNDPIVGTWKIIEITYNGEKYDEMGYSTFTPGGFWAVQLRTPNPLNLTKAAETLEEYKSVLGSYKAAFGFYKLKGDSCYCYAENDLHPEYVGNVVPGLYKVLNDTLIFDEGEWRYTWIRQK
jgi:hypothetical protein